MPTHSCIACPDGTAWCCICAGHQHGALPAPLLAFYPPPMAVPPMPQCLKIIDVFDEPHRCLNRTDGFKAYCDLHMPKSVPPPKTDWTMVVFFVMIGVAYVLGYWTHAWCLPWLRGA